MKLSKIGDAKIVVDGDSVWIKLSKALPNLPESFLLAEGTDDYFKKITDGGIPSMFSSLPMNQEKLFNLWNEKSKKTPVPLINNDDPKFDFYFFKSHVYQIEPKALDSEEVFLEIMEFEEIEEKKRKRFEYLKRKHSNSQDDHAEYVRERISEEIRIEVWRRDNGKCVRCGSREKLEYDHIVPVSKGGSNTSRNIELLCESCNRSKGANIQ